MPSYFNIFQQQLSSSCNFQRIIDKCETSESPAHCTVLKAQYVKSSALWFVSLSVAVADCSPVWQLLYNRQGVVCTWMSRFANVLRSQECLAIQDVWYQRVHAMPKFGIFWVADVLAPCRILNREHQTFADLRRVALHVQPDQACMSELDVVLSKQLSRHPCSKSLGIVNSIGKDQQRTEGNCKMFFLQAFRHV